MTDKPVIELGPGTDPDAWADTRVDILDVPAADVVHDLDETPWPFEGGSASGVIANHTIEHLADPVAAMREIARVLEPGGFADLRVPFGVGWWLRDPTHRNYWTWDTPRYFADDPEFGEDFYTGFGLALVDRHFEGAFLNAPWLSKLSPAFRWAARRWPGEWVTQTPYACGELVVRYEKEGQP